MQVLRLQGIIRSRLRDATARRSHASPETDGAEWLACKTAMAVSRAAGADNGFDVLLWLQAPFSE